MANLGPDHRVLCGVFHTGFWGSRAVDVIPEAAGKAIYVFFQSRRRHVKLGSTNALIGRDKTQFFKALQRGTHRSVGTACYFDDVFGDRRPAF